jgi:hypothetical protein
MMAASLVNARARLIGQKLRGGLPLADGLHLGFLAVLGAFVRGKVALALQNTRHAL